MASSDGEDLLAPTCVSGRMCVAVLLDKCLDLCRRQLVPSAITGGCESDCRDDNCDARTCPTSTTQAAPTPSTPTPPSPPDASPEMCLDTEHCGIGMKHCLDVCHRRNHPNGPADDSCRQGCFEDYCPTKPCPSGAP